MLGNYADYLAANAREIPNRLALKDATHQLTYAALDALVTRSALALRSHGVMVGEIIGICLPDTALHVAMLLAVSRLGAVILPMDHRWTPVEAVRIASQFAIQRMVVAQGREPPPGVTAIPLDAAWDEAVAKQAATADDFPHDPTMPMLLSMSSGTTGTPKGPLSTQAAQMGRALAGAIKREDVVFMATPLYFGGGRGFALAGVLRGATVVLFPPPFRPEQLVAAMAAEGATYGFLTPTQMRRLLQLPDEGRLLLPTLRLLISSGAVLYPEERAAIMRRLTPASDEPVLLYRRRQRRSTAAGASGREGALRRQGVRARDGADRGR